MIAVVAVASLVLGLMVGLVLTRRRDLAVLRESAGLDEDALTHRSIGETGRLLASRIDQARAESVRLTRLEKQLEAGVTSSEVGIVLCDSDGTVVMRNPVASAFAEARHSEALVASTVTDLLRSARQGATGERLVELVGPPRRTYRVSAQPLTSGDEPLGAVAFITDVSETQRVDQVRRDFVANVSHELKTPIGALSLLAETLTVDDEPEVVERLIGRIQSEAQRVADTIDDLMTLSSIEDGDGSRFGEVDLREVVDAVLGRLREAAELQGVELLDPEPGGPLGVFGERVQLESAVFNLVDNAVKYCERGDRVEVRLAKGGGLVAVAIQDDGVGIPASELGRIFERFYRVDKARSRVTGGTGLGLAIVRHVIQNHGGEIEVSSREGEGSTFTILLPAHEPADETETVPDTASGVGAETTGAADDVAESTGPPDSASSSRRGPT